MLFRFTRWLFNSFLSLSLFFPASYARGESFCLECSRRDRISFNARENAGKFTEIGT